MTMQLIKYDAACRALAEAHRIDEVKAIRDKAMAMKVYAKQANDRRLLMHATEIKLRAERRVGELLIEMRERGERQKPGDNPKGRNSNAALLLAPKLSDLGVTAMQSSRWQKLAALPDASVSRMVNDAITSIEQAKPKSKKPKQRRNGVSKKAGHALIEALTGQQARQMTEEEHRAYYRQNMINTANHAEALSGVFEGKYVNDLFGFDDIADAAERVVESWKTAASRVRKLANEEKRRT